VKIIDQWHTHPGYIDAVATILEEDVKANQFHTQQKESIILFTAHSLPADYVWEGDKYPYYIYETC
jgi:ferrochelatase